MPEWTRRVRVRLTVWYTLILLAFFGMVAGAFYVLLANSLWSAVDQSLVSQSRVSLAGINSENGRAVLEANPSAPPASDAVFALALVAADGSSQHTGPDALLPFARVTALAQQTRRDNRPVTASVIAGQSAIRMYARAVPDAPGTVLVIARTVNEPEQTLATARTAGLIVIPMLLLGGALLGYWVAGRALAPVRAMAATARSITDLHLDRRLNLRLPNDEIGELASTFDAMLARLETAFESLRRFTADASHELRAPLAVLRTEADVTLARRRSPQEYRESLARIVEETAHLSAVVDDLLMLARADAGRETMTYAPVDLGRLLHDGQRRWKPMASMAGVAMSVHANEVRIEADRDHLLRALDNLVDNAIRYSRPNGRVTVDLSLNGDAAIAVRDTGIGIAGEHLPHLFERFYRADPSRTRDEGGSGLGLALVDWVARAHGGSVDVRSTPGRGSTFTLHIPVSRGGP